MSSRRRALLQRGERRQLLERGGLPDRARQRRPESAVVFAQKGKELVFHRTGRWLRRRRAHSLPGATDDVHSPRPELLLRDPPELPDDVQLSRLAVAGAAVVLLLVGAREL